MQQWKLRAPPQLRCSSLCKPYTSLSHYFSGILILSDSLFTHCPAFASCFDMNYRTVFFQPSTPPPLPPPSQTSPTLTMHPIEIQVDTERVG
jgi:hypothetical protein